MKRVYLAGPMTGYDNHNYPEFERVTKILNGRGYNVLNPAHNFQGRDDLPYDWYIREDLKLMSFADMIVFLEGWRQSKGCILELHAAWIMGLDIRVFSVYDELDHLVQDPHEILIHELVARKFWITVNEFLERDDNGQASD